MPTIDCSLSLIVRYNVIMAIYCSLSFTGIGATLLHWAVRQVATGSIQELIITVACADHFCALSPRSTIQHDHLSERNHQSYAPPLSHIVVGRIGSSYSDNRAANIRLQPSTTCLWTKFLHHQMSDNCVILTAFCQSEKHQQRQAPAAIGQDCSPSLQAREQELLQGFRVGQNHHWQTWKGTGRAESSHQLELISQLSVFLFDKFQLVD